MESMFDLVPVWSDFTKFGNIERSYFVFGKILNLLWQILIVAKGQITNK